MDVTTSTRKLGGFTPTAQKTEWLRIADATLTRGIGRSSLYELITSGAIKSVVVKKRGNIKGIRLISADSLDAYIESFVTTSKK